MATNRGVCALVENLVQIRFQMSTGPELTIAIPIPFTYICSVCAFMQEIFIYWSKNNSRLCSAFSLISDRISALHNMCLRPSVLLSHMMHGNRTEPVEEAAKVCNTRYERYWHVYSLMKRATHGSGTDTKGLWLAIFAWHLYDCTSRIDCSGIGVFLCL